jgi:hypothetical protein
MYSLLLVGTGEADKNVSVLLLVVVFFFFVGVCVFVFCYLVGWCGLGFSMLEDQIQGPVHARQVLQH